MIDFPQATLAQLLWGLGLFAGLIIVAFSVERLRQRKRTRLQRANEWETVESIIRDKELTPEEQKALRALIRKQSPKEPLRAVTVRQHFEQQPHRVAPMLIGLDLDAIRAILKQETNGVLAEMVKEFGKRVRQMAGGEE